MLKTIPYATHGIQYIYTLAISKDNKYLAAGGGTNNNPNYDLKVFLLQGNSVEVYKVLKGHTNYVVRF